MRTLLIFGAMLGSILGILSSTVDIFIWYHMGHPPVLIRQGFENTHIACMVISGLFAGLLYGLILNILFYKKTLKKVLILISTVLIAIVFYVIGDYITIKILKIWPNLCAHIVVFLISFSIADFFSKSSLGSNNGNNTNISTHLSEKTITSINPESKS